MGRFLKQPLLHFLLAGALLFIVYGLVEKPVTSTDMSSVQGPIIVDRAALLDYMQYQSKAFDAALFNQRLDAMGDKERQALIKDYVREESLYREALRLKLDNGDYIIKQRLVQKEEFLLENTVADTINPGDDELKRFYSDRISDYKVDPVYSFTHVFFDSEKGGMDAARMRAEQLLPKLSGKTFADAGQFGDRFPFLQNYVERTREFVANNFSEDFVGQLDTLSPSDSRWYGPFASRYGYHLVLLIKRTPAATMAFDQIHDKVLDDYRYEELARKRQAAEDKVTASYDVQIKLGQAK